MSERERTILLEEIWLRYYNDYLLKHGVITEYVHRQMFVKIIERTAKLKRQAKV